MMSIKVGRDEDWRKVGKIIFSKLFPVSGGGGETGGIAIYSLPTASIPGERPPMSSQGSHCRTYSEGSAQVVAIVLKCC